MGAVADGKSWLAEAKGGRLKERLGGNRCSCYVLVPVPSGSVCWGGGGGYRYCTSNEIWAVRFWGVQQQQASAVPLGEVEKEKKKGRNERRWTGGICCG